MRDRVIIWKLTNWLFGAAFLAIGLVNVFWGNDAAFGGLIIVLSLFYIPPVISFLKRRTGFTFPSVVKILLGVFITWAALGVGELFDKLDMMVKSF